MNHREKILNMQIDGLKQLISNSRSSTILGTPDRNSVQLK
jgi:hypothetical protein